MNFVRNTVLAGVIAAAAAGGVAPTTVAFADGIAPGLWRIVSRTETGGVIGPPHERSRCISADEARDLVTAFPPPASAENANCTAAEQSLDGQKLNWRINCKGQTDMEQSGEFNFDSPNHYTATLRTRATVSGKTMIDSQDMIEGRWVSACGQ